MERKLNLQLVSSLDCLTNRENFILDPLVKKQNKEDYVTKKGEKYLFINEVPCSIDPKKSIFQHFVLNVYLFSVQDKLKYFYTLLKEKSPDVINDLKSSFSRADYFISQEKCYAPHSVIQGGGYSIAEYQYAYARACLELYNYYSQSVFKRGISFLKRKIVPSKEKNQRINICSDCSMGSFIKS